MGTSTLPAAASPWVRSQPGTLTSPPPLSHACLDRRSEAFCSAVLYHWSCSACGTVVKSTQVWGDRASLRPDATPSSLRISRSLASEVVQVCIHHLLPSTDQGLLWHISLLHFCISFFFYVCLYNYIFLSSYVFPNTLVQYLT